MFCFFISATDLDSSGVSSKSLLSDKNIKSPALLWQKYRSTLSPSNIFKLLLVRAVFVIYVLVAVFFFNMVHGVVVSNVVVVVDVIGVDASDGDVLLLLLFLYAQLLNSAKHNTLYDL